MPQGAKINKGEAMHHKIMALGLSCCVSLSLLGCGILPETSDGRAENLVDREGVDIVAADAGRQIAVLKDKASLERFCMSPAPDFSRTAGSQVMSALPTMGGGSIGLGSNTSKGALDLGGRDPAVLIARELLYRACELASNTQADPATERAIYDKFLAAIIEIAKTRTGPGSAPLATEPSTLPPVNVTPIQPRVRRQSTPYINPHDDGSGD